jgi:hypothetical protein
MGALILAACLALASPALAADPSPAVVPPPPAVPRLTDEAAVQSPAPERPPDTEQAWRERFSALRTRIEERTRLLAIKRAELYDKIERGQTAKKPRGWAIEGFVINTEPPRGEEPRFIDPLEREVHDLEEEVVRLKRELRDLDFQASVAGVPKAWRED